MPIRFVFALFQVAVYAIGTAPDVSDMTKLEGECKNFEWATFENGTLRLLKFDDEPKKLLSTSCRQKLKADGERQYYSEIKSIDIDQHTGSDAHTQEPLTTQKEGPLQPSSESAFILDDV